MNSEGILIVDDHPVYREALADKLRERFESPALRVESAAAAGEGLEKVQADPARRWTVLLDLLMPGLSGLAGIRAFKAQPQVRHVVSISGLEEKLWESRTAGAGAAAFISKNSTSDSIARILAPLVGRMPTDAPAAGTPEPASFRLTSRQMEVLGLIGQGHPNKIIADQLQISEQTVKIHVNQIFKELRVFNRTQAVLAAQKHRLI